MSDAGKTIIFSTHVLHQAERLCDRVFLINQGVKLLDDPIEDIRDRYNPRVIAMELLEPCTHEIMQVEGVRESKSSDEGVKFDLHLNHDADARAIMNTLVSNYDIRAIEIRQPTLDDIFVELVQGAPNS